MIAEGKIPSKKIYEDDLLLAFHDIDPKAPSHFLVIPKEHIGSVCEINSKNSAIIAKIFERIAVIADELGLSQGYRVVTNCGKDAGQSVEHLHFHVLGGRTMAWPPG